MYITKTLLLFLILGFSNFTLASENPLIGKWKSNKSETIKLLDESIKLTPKARKILEDEEDFGNVTLTFTDAKIFTTFKNETDNGDSYKLIESNNGDVKIKVFSKINTFSITYSFKIKANRMVMSSSVSPYVVEVFYKVE